MNRLRSGKFSSNRMDYSLKFAKIYPRPSFYTTTLGLNLISRVPLLVYVKGKIIGNRKGFLMKVVYLPFLVILTGCKNRLETYEHIHRDERASVETEAVLMERKIFHGDQGSNDGSLVESGATTRLSRPESEHNVSVSQNAESPFSSSRGGKHVMNIGAVFKIFPIN